MLKESIYTRVSDEAEKIVAESEGIDQAGEAEGLTRFILRLVEQVSINN